MAFYDHIRASKRDGTIYVGLTDDLVTRVRQHRNDIRPGFTQRYGVTSLGVGMIWWTRGKIRRRSSAASRRG